VTDSALTKANLLLAAVAALTLAPALAACKGGAHTAGQPPETPSGLPVPRYVSLKFAEVNARSGPGDDYRPLWVYRAKGLPLQVVAETKDWRRVCDPTGALAWVKATGVDGRRTVIRLQPAPLPLLEKPSPSARTVAILAPRATAQLDRCKDGWCELKAAGEAGWVQEGQVWGSDERRQCR
jgi:SH3-like domain-containing protein